MTSPYGIRPRPPQSSPISNSQLFKSFEVTPKSAFYRVDLSLTNKYQKIGKNRCAQVTTAKKNKSHRQITKSFLIAYQMNNGDLHSSLFNESSLLHEKNRRNDVDFEKTQQNLHSLQNEQSMGFANNSSQKEVDINQEKCFADDSDFKHKKRFRKQISWGCYGVPYRKCHSSMEEKVVSVINKIKNGKGCQKEIQTLIQKTKKVSAKEINNKYFVSGIQLISKLALDKEYEDIFTPDLIKKLQQGLDDLKSRIFYELDNIKGFQTKNTILEQINFQKLELVRKAYKVLRKKLRSLKRQEVQNKAVQAADWFLQNKVKDIGLFYDQLAQS